MNPKIKNFLFFLLGAFAMMVVMYLFNNYKIEKIHAENPLTFQQSQKNGNTEKQKNSSNIDQLTNETTVINYVKANKKLPPYYITKSEARKFGWIASKGNLCEVLPGKAIGGDKFSNRQKLLPTGKQYYEADVNYHCGRRNADRIVFTKNGEVYLSKNHYKTFQKQ